MCTDRFVAPTKPWWMMETEIATHNWTMIVLYSVVYIWKQYRWISSPLCFPPPHFSSHQVRWPHCVYSHIIYLINNISTYWVACAMNRVLRPSGSKTGKICSTWHGALHIVLCYMRVSLSLSIYIYFIQYVAVWYGFDAASNADRNLSPKVDQRHQRA